MTPAIEHTTDAPSTHETEIVLVAAVAANGIIGASGAMPWHLPEDLKRFKAITMGHPLVMGRKTFEAIGRPLPGRRTIVVTRHRSWHHDGVETAPGLAEAIALASSRVREDEDGEDEDSQSWAPNAVMVVGGGQIYAEAMPHATRLEITHVAAAPAGDTVFPPIDPAVWHETARDDRDGYAFVTYRR